MDPSYGFEASMFTSERFYALSEETEDLFGLQNEKLSNSKKEAHIALSIFKKVASAETSAVPALESKLVVASSKSKDTFFEIIAAATNLSEKEVIKSFRKLIKENPEEIISMINMIAKSTNFKISKKIHPEFFLKLLKSSHSYDLLKRKYGKDAEFGDVHTFINYVRCEMASKLFHLDIDLHDISINSTNIFKDMAFERGRIHTFDPVHRASKKIIIALGKRSKVDFNGVKFQFIQPVRFEKTQ